MAKLYFHYSSMNAGKSTTLLQSSYNYMERGMHTLILAPALDDRFGSGRVTSRIGIGADALIFDREADIFAIVREENRSQKLNCVLIDEAQFLTKKQVFALGKVCDELNIPVLAYGLRTDFRGEPFEGSKYLLAWADNLKEIKTICHCGKKPPWWSVRTPMEPPLRTAPKWKSAAMTDMYLYAAATSMPVFTTKPS